HKTKAQLPSDSTKNTHNIKVGFFALTYGYEYFIKPKVALNVELRAIAIPSWNSNDWAIHPFLRVEPRYYYYGLSDVNYRDNLFLITQYISLSSEYSFNSLTSISYVPEEYVSIIPKWGIRNAIDNYFYLEGAIGAGIGFDRKNTRLVLGLDLKICY